MPGTGALLGAWLLLLLSTGFLTTSTYLYSEVIVPRQLESRDIFDNEVDVSYIIKAEGNYRIIHLKQISFVISNMPVYSYNMKGDAIADYPYIQDDCYYRGYVEDVQDSQVVLSTCNGLWGHLQIEHTKYEIEPFENSSTFQHLIYRRPPKQREPCRGILPEGVDLTSEDKDLDMVDSTLISDRATDDYQHYTSIRYLEYYAVADKSKFIAENRNESRLVLLMLHMMASVHSVYFPIGLRIYLVGLEIWTERDYITIGSTNLGITLDAFYHYATVELRHRVLFDHSAIITAKGSPAGLAWGDRFCLYNHASVSAVRAYGNLAFDAETIAHMLGHSLGFNHDDALANRTQGCDCNCTSPGKCMMTSGSVTCRRLSNCSRQVYYETIKKPGKECFLNVPAVRFGQKACGNAVLDNDEECDCGHNEEIEDGIITVFLKPQSNEESPNSIECRKSGCCQKDCKFKPGIDCLYGICCDNCKYVQGGVMCRKAASKCDLPEYCNGISADCPPDVHKQDGMPCGRRDHCYMGNCLNHHSHCTALFGKGAKSAPLSCFEEVNMRGDRSGNCGQDGQTYKKCGEEDILCGRIQCVNVKSIPNISTGQAIIQTPVDDAWCWGTQLHLGQDAFDLGAVRDGTACGANKMCLNRSCVDLSVLRFDCNFSKCNNRGVCNTNRNCHCNYGWAPPFCEDRGYGGSLDSGPVPPYTVSIGLIVGVTTLLGLALLILGAAVLKRERVRAWFSSKFQKNVPPELDDRASLNSQGTQENTSVKSQQL